jgi:hypothetical protein
VNTDKPLDTLPTLWYNLSIVEKVGIKIANGEFYPILDEYSVGGKRLTLSTVHDGQTHAQIDFFSNAGRSMTGARYLGTLVLDGLGAKYADETTIVLRVHSTDDGRILAEAYDADDDSNVSTLEIDLSPAGAGDEDFSGFDMEASESAVRLKRKARRKSPLVPIIVAVILLMALAVFLFFFVTRGTSKEEAAVRPIGAATETAASEQSLSEAAPVPVPAKDEAQPPPPPPPVAQSPVVKQSAAVPREATRPVVTNGSDGATGAVPLGRKALRTEG